MRKAWLTAIAFTVIMACVSCSSENLEGLEEYEGIYHPLTLGYNIDLKRGDTVYTPYAAAIGADETYADLDFPQGNRIGFLRTTMIFIMKYFGFMKLRDIALMNGCICLSALTVRVGFHYIKLKM